MTPPIDLRQVLLGALNKRSTVYSPTSQDWPLLSNTEVVDDGFEILSVRFREVGGVGERLITNALTTNIVANLLKVR